ncbi:Type 4 prepilin-like proteins leader peptide-processing enzyme [Sphingomonas sp. EC-HK361]|uniref:prepilin peptidase n=1 Tax=Sphingomonas sp. EC-HK361 TaxID=2038397 RepID=UPI0012599264|nr:A24 family peptidase [Sphingomonas sp. EC-HK361]VVT08652.1 Type 4 prepilin-like proteins leader peptide-processing enzyme [Sphingomonas sp. EC-HK361]
MTEAAAWALALFVLGAITGSFLANLAIRWPREQSVMRGRSACDACGKTLGAGELIPLVSAAIQRGKCRGCSAAIDPRHWQIELGCALIGAAAGFVVAGPVAVAGAIFGWLLLTLAAIDVAEFWLPDALTATLAVAGLVSGIAGIAPDLTDRVIGGAGGFAALWLVAFAYRRLREREGLGGGDPKLFGAIGLWLGWRMLPIVLLLASAVGLALVLAEMLSGRKMARDTRLPFGALLAVAAYPAWLVMIGSMP